MEWLQLVYRVPAEPSRKRTYVWRQLRGLGAATVAIALAALVAGAVLGLNAALIVVVAGLAGIPLFSGRATTAKAAGVDVR